MTRKAHRRRSKAGLWAGAAVAVAGIGLAAYLFFRSPEAASMGEVSVFLDPPDEILGMLRELFEGSPIPLWFALANGWLESRFNPRAFNREGSYGLFQIYWRAHGEALQARGVTDPEMLYDARTNAEYWKDLVTRLARQQGATVDGDPREWEEVRLRLAGVRPAHFGGATALRILTRYRPQADKWREYVETIG